MANKSNPLVLLFAILQLLVSGVSPLSAQTAYAQWPNFPQNPNFFPIAVWLTSPNRQLGPGAPFATAGQAAAAAKINIFLGIDNGGVSWPSGNCVGDSNGYLATIKSLGMYAIPDVNVTNNTSANSISSIECLASSIGALGNVIGWNLGDEAQCGSALTAVPGQAGRAATYDSTRPSFYNMNDWVFGHGVCNPASQNINALQAASIGSFDLYPIISPWNGNSNIPLVSGQPQDSMWIQGYSVNRFIANARPGQPIWAFVETGATYGYSTQNGSSCNIASNLCTPHNNEYRATNEQVNAEAWMSIINGAKGIEWFCHDSEALAYCLGDGGSAKAVSIQANLTYVDTAILSFAQQLNAPTVGMCTMNTDTSYANFKTSCSDGVLTMSTGNPSVPGSALVKSFNGDLYLFADSDRNGSAAMTFALTGQSGRTAVVVYDSNAKYDPANSSVGRSFALNGSGQFSDTFGANGHNYQPKIYKVSGAVTATAPSITSASTATGGVGTSFSYPIIATNSPTAFDTVGLPAGLSINKTTGLISGTPTTAGSFNVTLTASNTAGTGTAVLVLTINAASGGPASSLFSASATPAVANISDGTSIELGVRFQASRAGQITGVRFYKGSQNVGTHTAHLWSTSGALLATAQFSNETASGWQTATFTTPIVIAGGTAYVASYHTSGYYSADNNFFTSTYVNSPLSALANGGVYTYGRSARFPSSTYRASNYWVDVIFQ